MSSQIDLNFQFRTQSNSRHSPTKKPKKENKKNAFVQIRQLHNKLKQTLTKS